MSLRWRIALALAAVAAATTISVGIVSYRATSTRLLEEVDRSLDQAWRTIQADPLPALDQRGLLDVYMVQTVGPGGRRHRARNDGRSTSATASGRRAAGNAAQPTTS